MAGKVEAGAESSFLQMQSEIRESELGMTHDFNAHTLSPGDILLQKATPPKAPQTMPPTEAKGSNIWACEGLLIQTSNTPKDKLK